MALGKITISTHVLDTACGKPAAGVEVRLERKNSEQWLNVACARTDQNGRCAQLAKDEEELVPGIYRLSFDTEGYFATQKMQALYPIVQITFHVRDGEGHYHIPLLLNPYGYTTYRGS
jgi:5-hydroxyisourate hydrolase